MTAISLNVNGVTHAIDVAPETPLLYVLGDELHFGGNNAVAGGFHLRHGESPFRA